jgi:uncharacterized protein (DUF433 family)
MLLYSSILQGKMPAMSRPKPDRGRKTASRSRSVVSPKEAKPRGQEPRVLTTMRLRRSLRRDLETTAERTRRSVADVAQELLDEALRMRQCPGIYFADEPSGRTAKIGGTGLGVWEVLRDFTRDQDHGRIRKAFPQLSQAQVTAALMYYSRYRDEIQTKIDANAALTRERIERQYPGLVRFTR